MSTFKRLLPAPPPTINAWSINQLINITDKDGSHLHKLHGSNSDDNDSISSGDIEILSGPLKSISSPQSPISSSIKDSVTIPFSAPVTDTKSIDDNDPIMVVAEGNDDEEYDEDGDVLVSVGKNIKIKKPKFPKSNKIKGGTGHYKYRITDTSKDSPPFIINSGSHSPIQQDYSMPSPVESISGGPSSSSPHMLVYPQFGIPIYHVSMVNNQSPPLQTSPVFTASPVSPKSGSTKKDNIKRQIEYYFSTENLCKDTYLRSLFNKMDGSVKIDQLLTFNRMKILTKNGKYTNLVLESIQEIQDLELLDDNNSFRIKNWQNWTI